MNDFTKEELKEISYCIAYTYNHDHDLAKKIESMIDNYCVHDWENTCCSCAIYAIQCIKCNKTLESRPIDDEFY